MPKVGSSSPESTVRWANVVSTYPETYVYLRRKGVRTSLQTFNILSCIACKTTEPDGVARVSSIDMSGCAKSGTTSAAIVRLLDREVIDRTTSNESTVGRPPFDITLNDLTPAEVIEELLENRPCHRETQSIIPPLIETTPS